MATIKEIDDRIVQIEADLAALAEQELKTGNQLGNLVRIGGRTVTKNELGQLRQQLQSELDELNAIAQPYFDAKNAYKDAMMEIAPAKEQAKDPKGLLTKKGTLTTAERSEKLLIQKAQKKVKDIERTLPSLKKKSDQAEKASYNVPQQQQDFSGSPELVQAYRRAFGTPRPATGKTATTPKPTTAATGVSRGGGGGSVGGTRRPQNPKVGDKWTGPKGVTWEWTGKKWKSLGKQPVVGGEQWQAIIQEEFGSLWDVYNNNADVKAVIDKSVQEGWFNDETKLNASLMNTGWYRTTEAAARQFSIRMSTDPATVEDDIATTAENINQQSMNLGITFNADTLRKLATDSIKFGYSEQQLLNAIGSESVAQATLGGPAGTQDLLRGTTAQSLRRAAKEYGQKMSDDVIESWTKDLMTGKKTSVQWEDMLKGQAYTQFRSLREALDRGETVESAMSAYKRQASSILEGLVNVDEIDWAEDKWNKALNYRDEKTNDYRQMDIWEWNKYLRTLPEWQETGNAKDIYRNVAMSLAQGFGKMA